MANPKTRTNADILKLFRQSPMVSSTGITISSATFIERLKDPELAQPLALICQEKIDAIGSGEIKLSGGKAKTVIADAWQRLLTSCKQNLNEMSCACTHT